jgi:hypothetical protein
MAYGGRGVRSGSCNERLWNGNRRPALSLRRTARPPEDVRYRGKSRKHLLTVRLSHFDPKRTLALGYPGHTQALIDTLAFGEKGWIVTKCAVAEAADGKAWKNRKSCFCSGAGPIQRAKQR